MMDPRHLSPFDPDYYGVFWFLAGLATAFVAGFAALVMRLQKNSRPD